MRRGSNPELLFTSDLNNKERDPQKKVKSGTFLGFNLSADYCAEHEWGIKGLDGAFERDKITHKISKAPTLPDKKRYGGGGMVFMTSKDKKTAVLMYNEYWNDEFLKKLETPMTGPQLEKVVGEYTRDLHLSGGWTSGRTVYPPDKISAAWDEKSFGILVKNGNDLLDMVAYLQSVAEAFAKKDVAIWLGGGGVFQNAGLCITIYSALPKDVLDGWKEFYEDCERLKKASDATGIEAKLKAAGKRWFALSPRWIKEFKDKSESKHPVIYWLNPNEQHIHNFGWFTVEQLEQWAEDKGPCMMTKEEKAKRGR
jgi:hypothetical protein